MACLIIILAAVGPLLGAWAVVRLSSRLEAQRRLRGECPLCGYDRVGLIGADLCPECGKNIRDAALASKKRVWMPVALPLGFGLLLSVMFAILGQPLTSGEEAWAALCIMVPLLVVSGSIALGKFATRPWIAWILMGVPSGALACLLVPTYLRLAFATNFGEYGRGFDLQVFPLITGVLGTGGAGWGTAILAWIIAAFVRTPSHPPADAEIPGEPQRDYWAPW